MIRSSRILSSLLIVTLAIYNHCNAQTKQFQHISSADGISQSEIYSFLEDSHGFMWFGTVDGLNRYDGYKVSIFNIDKDNPNSITNNTIRCLAEDSLGRIWIGTDDGLCFYDSKLEKIHQIHLSGFNENRLTIKSALINKNTLYIGTSHGLLSIAVSSTNLEDISNSVHQVKINNDQNQYEIVASLLSAQGIIWVATTNSLYQLNTTESDIPPTLTKTLNLSETLNGIRNLEEDGLGNLWIVSHENGFARYKPQFKTLTHFSENLNNPSVSSNKMSSVIIDKTGDLWLGTHDNGLLLLEAEHLNDENPKFQSITHDPYNMRSLSSNLIYSLYVSKSNLIWIGTIGSAINIYDPYRKPFQYYNLHNAANQSSYSTNFIRAVYADKNDNIWIGTHNNGLFYFDRNHNENINKIGFSNESIFHINDAGDGNTLVCSGVGISLVNHSKGSVDKLSSLDLGPTFFTTTVNEGIFWVATLSGLKKCKLANKTISLEQEYSENTEPSISFNNCRVLHYSVETNELYIGTEGGGLNVMELDNDMVPIRTNVYKKSDSKNSLSNNYIRSIIKASNSDLWIGTYEGLNKMSKDDAGSTQFKSYTKVDGLPNNTIQSITEDNQHNLWIGTNNGLCKFDPQTDFFTHYTLNDGIQSNEFSEHTIFKKHDNEIIIGGINGINTFYPEQINSNDLQPNTTITDFYLFNKNISAGERTDHGTSPLKKSILLTDSIFLKPRQNSFGFDFSAMIYNSPEKVQYAYFLEGFDEEWVYTDASSRKANYTNLEYGDYIFNVKATDNDGLWEKTPQSIFLSIKTPFHLTTLAFILYGLLAIFAFIFFTNYSVLRYTTKQKILLENKHNKKIRELEELRTRFFINVSHDLRTPLTLISSPLELILKNTGLQSDIKSLLDLMHRNVTRLREMTEQLLDISKVEAGNLDPKPQHKDIVAFIKNEVSLFKTAFEIKGIDLNVTSDEDHFVVSFDPDMISKVMSNIISNALKHTQRGHVAIHISRVHKQTHKNHLEEKHQNDLKIIIKDTGDGIDQADLAMVFERFFQGKDQNKKGYGIGLSHSKDLVEAHHGSVDVLSEKGVGSTFIIYLPNIQKPENISTKFQPEVEGKHAAPAITKSVLEGIKEKTPAEIKSKQILIVEDNLDLRNFISKELSIEYEVLVAADGKEGLQLANEHFPDIILSDVMMPNMNGMDFCKAIKSNLKTSHIPVVLLTAKIDKESKYQGLEFGADDYIPKPFEIEHLLIRMKNLLENRERLRTMFQLSAKLEPSRVTVTSIDEDFLSNLMSNIEKGISKSDFSINTLESEMGMSHSSFYNKIKSLTGHSAKELVFNVRMKRAKQILEETSNIRISEVAYMVGFSDPKYFSKRFKEFFGNSPSTFSKNKSPYI